MLFLLACALSAVNFVAAVEDTRFEVTGGHRIAGDGRIVGGSPASEGQWPWQVAIYTSLSQENYTFTCGGSLISKNYVLSAAHCFNRPNITGILLRIGVHDLTNPSSNTVERYTNSYRIHEDYNASTYKTDVSLIYFNDIVTYNSYIQPIGLPAATVTVSGGESCVISGFGETNGTGQSIAQLRYANVDIIDTTTCNNWYSADNITVTNDQICAGFEAGGIDTCQGDSGGPLACRVSNSSDSPYVIQGITSFGVGCALARRPGVYTSIQSYVDWIVQHTISETGERIPLISDPGNGAMYHGLAVYSWLWLLGLHRCVQLIVE